MVIGIDKFREHFTNFEDNYIVIGGAACDWLMSHTPGSIPFRATHDIDLVICAETMTPAFGSAVWNFVRDGDYSVYERKDGQNSFFRFLDPSTPGYPAIHCRLIFASIQKQSCDKILVHHENNSRNR